VDRPGRALGETLAPCADRLRVEPVDEVTRIWPEPMIFAGLPVPTGYGSVSAQSVLAYIIREAT